MPALSLVAALALAAALLPTPGRAAEDSAAVRARAAATARLADPALLASRLAGDPEPLVRAAAAEALGRRRDPAAARPLSDALGRDPDPDVREEAARALAALAVRVAPGLFGRAWAEYLPKDAHLLRDRPLPAEAVAALGRAAADPSRPVRLAAVRALGEVGPSAAAAAPAVAARLANGDDAALRSLAAQTLGRLGDPSQARALVSALEDPSGQVRAAAARALGRLPDADPGPLLHVAARDRNGGVRAAALEAAASAGAGPRLVPVLVAALDDPGEAARAAAADGLTRLADTLDADRAARLALDVRLARERGRAARAALLALAARLRPAAAGPHVEALVGALEDRGARRAAERGLVRLAAAGIPVAETIRARLSAPAPMGGPEGLAARALARVEARAPLVLPEVRP